MELSDTYGLRQVWPTIASNVMKIASDSVSTIDVFEILD